MSRILIAWELGGNWGHLSRLVPLAAALKSRGHSVLAMVPDIAAASAALQSADVTFIQSPCPSAVKSVGGGRPTGYAHVLLSNGWDDRSALWGMLQAWMGIYGLFRPDAVVLDYAPTARLCAYLLKIPAVLIGTGFELPPATRPLPPFPGFSWATQAAATQCEARVLDNLNAVLRAYQAAPLDALCPLVEAECRFLTTFAALNQYGGREKERYIGPLSDPLQGRPVDWPRDVSRRVFAYLRPEVPELTMILEGLAAADAGIIAYVPGLASDIAARLATPRCILSTEPVLLAPLLEKADAVVSYAPAGTVTTALLRGVPQLMAPVHIESQLTAQRIAFQGMGRVLQKPTSPNQVTHALHAFLDSPEMRLRARAFAERHRNWNAAAALGTVVEAIEALCTENLCAENMGRFVQRGRASRSTTTGASP